MGIDYNIINEALLTNLLGLLKLIAVSFLIFYWVPSKIFPQDFMRDTMDKVMFNILYSVGFVILVIPQLVLLKIFSIPIFILILIGLKILFIIYYEKRNIHVVFYDLRKNTLIKIFDFFDNYSTFWANVKEKRTEAVSGAFAKITIYKFLLRLFYMLLFGYAIFNIGFSSLVTFTDASPDNAFFITWVTFLKENVLWSDLNTFGADMYGLPIFVFNLSLWSNIDAIVLFKIYPILLTTFYFFVIYYVLYRMFNSRYSALFGVFILSLVFFSPLNDYFAGQEFTTTFPEIVTFFEQFSVYFVEPTAANVQEGNQYGYIPYTRFVAALNYEFAYSLFLLNLYFFARLINTKLTIDLILYGLTLFLVFSFHGGGAVFLLPASLIVMLNGFLFRRITVQLFIKGTLVIFLAVFLGNLWMFAMLKYGLVENVGNALPFLDELLGNERNAARLQETGKEALFLLVINPIQYVMIGVSILAAIGSFFVKRDRFIVSSLMLSMVAVFFIFYMPHLGLTRVVAYTRGIEYLMTAQILSITFVFYYLFNIPIKKILKTNYSTVMLSLSYLVLAIASVSFPKWYNMDNPPESVQNSLYPYNVEAIGYSATAQTLLDINEFYRPYSWTVISYIQEYSKAKDKGYHLNTQNFVTEFDPMNRYLEIPTRYVFIMEEKSPNSYKGLNEWWYRWKLNIQDNLRSWIAMYSKYHDSIRLYKTTQNINVYLIDNKEYLDYLRKIEKEKK